MHCPHDVPSSAGPGIVSQDSANCKSARPIVRPPPRIAGPTTGWRTHTCRSDDERARRSGSGGWLACRSSHRFTPTSTTTSAWNATSSPATRTGSDARGTDGVAGARELGCHPQRPTRIVWRADRIRRTAPFRCIVRWTAIVEHVRHGGGIGPDAASACSSHVSSSSARYNVPPLRMGAGLRPKRDWGELQRPPQPKCEARPQGSPVADIERHAPDLVPPRR